MNWLNTAGGPFVISPRERLADWGGVETSSFTGLATSDYDEACQISDLVGVLSNGEDSALVLADEPHQTAIQVTNHGILFIRWVYAPNERRVWDAVHSVNEDRFHPNQTLEVRSSEMVMFDSAIPGGSVRLDDWGVFSLPLGRNVVETAEYSDEETSIILHRIRLSSLG